MKLLRALLLAPLCAVALDAQTVTTADAAHAQEMDAYVAKAVKDWHVAGLAIAVVKDGRVVFSKGYGVRELGKPATVDTSTLFAIASTTKAMTATSIGMLVDEGKISWDDPVTKFLPSFQMYDPYVTREIRIRDLLTHRAGLGNADWLWDATSYSRPQIVEQVRFLKPEYSFRSGFIYQNIMYIVAGEVVAAASGMPWEKFIRTRIFGPLGMTSSVPLQSLVPAGADMASPHWLYGGDTLGVIVDTDPPASGPAGGVWSNVADMSRWMRFLLDSGRIGGKRLLKAETYSELFNPQTMVPPSEFYPSAELTKPHWTTYGLGWFQEDYQGRMLNFHTGSLNGMVSIIGLICDSNFGVYVLANVDHAEVRHALMYKAVDLYLGNASRDWSTEFRTLYARRRAVADSSRIAADAKRILGTRPSLSLSQYAGVYENAQAGRITVTSANGKLRIAFGKVYSGDLEHWQYDTFRIHYDKRWQGTDQLSFVIGDGIPRSMEWGFSFSRVGGDRSPATH